MVFDEAVDSVLKFEPARCQTAAYRWTTQVEGRPLTTLPWLFALSRILRQLLQIFTGQSPSDQIPTKAASAERAVQGKGGPQDDHDSFCCGTHLRRDRCRGPALLHTSDPASMHSRHLLVFPRGRTRCGPPSHAAVSVLQEPHPAHGAKMRLLRRVG